MKKIVLGAVISLVTLTLAACGNTSNGKDNTQKSVNSSSVRVSSSHNGSQKTNTNQFTADQLSPAQTAALVLYYNDAHMPGSSQHDYSANMSKSGQGATVKIYNQDNVPKGEGPLYKTYPNSSSLLYSVKLTNGKNDGGHLDSTYYTIADNKIYAADSDAGIQTQGTTVAAMVAYAKKHSAVSRINNVAQNTKIIDMRAKTNSSSLSNSNKLTTQQLGTLVALNKNPDWFKEYLNDGVMYYGTADSDYSDGVRGYDYVTANGDPTSYIWFKRNGNDVTIKTVEPQGDQSVAEAPMVTKHVTVSGLLRDYYTNQSQKDEVNGYADQLQPESNYLDKINNN